jgi:inorganic pyrophosphatase
MGDDEFWHSLDVLVETSELVIDRPRGSAHPRYPEFRYPLDYGYLAETHSGDGRGIDVWVGSDPEKRPMALVLTLDLHKRDTEPKILLGCTSEEVQLILAIHRRGMQFALSIERELYGAGMPGK